MAFNLMLAKQAKDLSYLDSKFWLIEPKYDGIRAVAYIDGNSHKLINRSGIDVTDRFPEIKFPNVHAVLDGELFCLQDDVPNFQLMQTRMNRTLDIWEHSKSTPATYAAFDILQEDGKNITDIPLIERKMLLSKLEINSAPYVIADPKFASNLKEDGWEGVMVKHLNSPYLQGRRSKLWLKIKFKKTAIVTILGALVGAGKREKIFGSLVMGVKGTQGYHYCGNLGTGFTDKEAGSLYESLLKIKSDVSFLNSPIILPILFWVKPKIQVEVEYLELSNSGMLRHPSFLGVVNELHT